MGARKHRGRARPSGSGSAREPGGGFWRIDGTGSSTATDAIGAAPVTPTVRSSSYRGGPAPPIVKHTGSRSVPIVDGHQSMGIVTDGSPSADLGMVLRAVGFRRAHNGGGARNGLCKRHAGGLCVAVMNSLPPFDDGTVVERAIDMYPIAKGDNL